MNANESNKAASGVQQLVDKLRQEGIEAGQKQAEEILADARRRAEEILSEAKQKAEALVAGAQQHADKQIQSVRDALQLAFRDSVLAYKEYLTGDFALRLKRLVQERTLDAGFLQQMILQVAGRSLPQGVACESLEILLPGRALNLEELRHEPRPGGDDALGRFVAQLAAEQLREGVTLRVSGELTGGIRVRIVDKDIELKFTDEAIVELLLEYLAPRYRALLDGIVK